MTNLERRFITARRAAITADFQKLNPRQQEGVLTTEGPLLLLAGAGSGKTTVLINRVANLLRYGRGDCENIPVPVDEDTVTFLEEYVTAPAAEREEQRPLMQYLCAVEPASPWEVLAITFTNKAANELKERLGRMLGEEQARDVWASTFHSACVRILRRDIDRIGFDRSFTIYDSDDSKRVIKDVLKELSLEEKSFPPREILSVISQAKDSMQSPEEFIHYWEGVNDWRRIRIGKVYALYSKKLREANALDFDDIILHTVRLLESCPDVLERYQRKFRYILIDEYQDTNRMHFEKEYRGARTIRLEQNYRSTQNILDAANAVIRHNEGRKGKTLWTENGDGEKVIIKTAFNESDEANYVVGQVMTDYRRGGNWKDHAVLYRMNAQSNALEYAFKRNGVPYKIYGGMKFFDRAEIKDMLAYLCVINNPTDDLRLRRIVNVPSRKIGQATVDKAQTIATEQEATLYQVFRQAADYPELKNAAGKLIAFTELIESIRRQVEGCDLIELYDMVCDKSGYTAALREKNDMESRGRLENVEELKSSIQGYLENVEGEPSLSGFLDEVALYTDLDSQSDSDNCVTMMTMHAAKGLEFPHVYVVGMEDGLFPGNRAMGDAEEMEEERRLCYVAMTRAKETLVLTNARQRMLFGRTAPAMPSRFLKEIPEENMEWLSKPQPRSTESNWDSVGWGDGAGDSRSSRYAGYDSYGEKYGSYSSHSAAYGTQSTMAHETSGPQKAPLRSSSGAGRRAPSGGLMQLAPGESVRHDAFGQGMVLSVRVMGNDALIEVAFDTVGTKKLMLRAAMGHLSKG